MVVILLDRQASSLRHCASERVSRYKNRLGYDPEGRLADSKDRQTDHDPEYFATVKSFYFLD